MTQGYRDDSGKIRWDLLPVDAIEGISQVMTWACTSRKPTPYPERNWERGMAWSRFFNSALRHAWAMWRGIDLDPDSGLPHADHFATNALMLAAHFRRPWLKHLDDRVALQGPVAGVLDPLRPCTSCQGKEGYHRTPCGLFEVSSRERVGPA